MDETLETMLYSFFEMGYNLGKGEEVHPLVTGVLFDGVIEKAKTEAPMLFEVKVVRS